MEIICYKCRYPWDYRGKSSHYVCCPKCLSKISLRKIHKIHKKNYIPTEKLHNNKGKYIKTKTDFKVTETKYGDKLLVFENGLKVLIPRPEVLMEMLV